MITKKQILEKLDYVRDTLLRQDDPYASDEQVIMQIEDILIEANKLRKEDCTYV